MCSAVTVECCILYQCYVGMLPVMYGRRLFSSVFAITEIRDMGLYAVPLAMSLLGIGIGTMFANFQMCGIMLLLRAVLNMLVRNANPRGPNYFRCLMLSWSGPCELLFLVLFNAFWICVVVSVMLYPYIFWVALLMDLFVLFVACLTVFVTCLMKQFAIWLLFCC